MADEGTPFHPLVTELLDDFGAGANGPEIPAEDMARWAKRLAGRSDKRDIALHLIVVAMRFRKHSATDAMEQMILLAAGLLGDVATQSLLEQQGLPSQEAQAVVGKARGVAPPLAGGLAPPSGGGFKRGG